MGRFLIVSGIEVVIGCTHHEGTALDTDHRERHTVDGESLHRCSHDGPKNAHSTGGVICNMYLGQAHLISRNSKAVTINTYTDAVATSDCISPVAIQEIDSCLTANRYRHGIFRQTE